MNIYPNVTQTDLIRLTKLAEEQKDQRAIKKFKKKFNQIHDIILAENLSPFTKKLSEFKESTKELGKKIEKSQPKLAI